MLEFALHNEVKNYSKNVFDTHRLIFDTEQFFIYEPDYYVRLDNALYFLINDELDIPSTARIIIEAQNNFLMTTKDAYNSKENLKPFRGYLKILTQNYGLDFTPFTLTFLKVTPYES